MNSSLIYLVVPKKKDDPIVPPFAAMFLSSALKKHGFHVRVQHIDEEHIDDSVNSIIEDKPLFVGFSVFTGIYTLYAAQMSQLIKTRAPTIPIVWGGVHPSLLPEQCIQEEYIDYLITFEGEEAITEFAHALQKNKSVQDILNVAYKDSQGIHINSKRPLIKNIDTYRLDFDAVNMEEYIIKNKEVIDGKEVTLRSIGYYSSRGCVFDCAFCYNLQYFGKKWRAYSTQIVLEDIRYLQNTYGINDVMFWDDHFFVNRFRALDILKALHQMGIYGTGSDIRLDSFNKTYLQELKKLNIRYFLIGAESGSDRILKFINKGFDTAYAWKKIELLAKYDIPTQYSFIVGLPTETKQEFYETIEFMYKIYTTHKKGTFTFGIYMPYPGGTLFTKAVELGFQPPTTTAGWHVLDRWRNAVTIPWVDKKIARNVRQIFSMLRWNLGPFNTWLEYRIKKKWLHTSFDLKLLILFHNYLLQRDKQNYSLTFLIKKRIKKLFFEKNTVNSTTL